MSVSQPQYPMSAHNWTIGLSNHWDVLGPFPQNAREQHFLSPSFPLNLSEPIDFSEQWPSSYADGALVSWSSAESSDKGDLQVSFPSVRWQNLLDTEGWAAIQYHSSLRSIFTIHPSTQSPPPTHILVNLIQGTYFAIVPTEHTIDYTPKWHMGNVYALPRVSPRLAALPTVPSIAEPTTYELWVSGDYEVRLFGRSANPTLSLTVQVSLPDIYMPASVNVIEDRLIAPDFVDGLPFGNAVGVAIQNQNTAQWVDIVGIESQNASLELLAPRTSLAPTQTRIIPLIFSTLRSYNLDHLKFALIANIPELEQQVRLDVSIPVSHHTLDSGSSWSAINVVKGTYFYASSQPSVYYAIPPSAHTEHEIAQPAILALHGAGVDILSNSFWFDALPRNPESWILVATGRTSWGLDWHGPSQISSINAVEALRDTVGAHDWDKIDVLRLLVMGHSNGGQGAWHLAARWPDRIIGAVPAAAFIKAQQYVPLTHSRSTHYVDPALRTILDTALTPDDNDLHLSNLVDTPILAIHGGNDDNVPTFHSREAFSVLKTWSSSANITYQEDTSQLHWYDTVLNNDKVRQFVNQTLTTTTSVKWTSFTLTVSIPANQGSLHGLRVLELATPERLGRLLVHKASEATGSVVTRNVRSFSLNKTLAPFVLETIDGTPMNIPSIASDTIVFIKVDGVWEVSTDGSPTPALTTRIQAILSSPHNLKVVVDDSDPATLDAAIRIGADLDMYHELDLEILSSSHALASAGTLRGNIIYLGNSLAARKLLSQELTPFKVSDSDGFSVHGRRLDRPGLGFLFLHPHPSGRSDQVSLFLQATDAPGLERALRLFPIRTGIPVPDWIVSSELCDVVGLSGVVGAGLWNRWQMNEAASWLD